MVFLKTCLSTDVSIFLFAQRILQRNGSPSGNRDCEAVRF